MDRYWLARVTTRALSVIAGGALMCLPLDASAENQPHAGHAEPQQTAMSHQLPAWAEQLKGQTIVEDAIVGKPERSAMVEQQHQRIMDHLSQDPQVQQVNTGMFNTQTMMHQYGAGGQDLLLMSDPRVEPVAMTGGGKCPATAPVRQYNVSAINVEITLNQWLDFYPGYMYTLDENLDKVREEETKNREARDKEGFDPGAVIPGVQAQWIQPLAIRGNQGDCVKIKLSNKLEGGEDVSLHIHGSSMVVSATGASAATTNSDSIVAKEKSGEFEWYIHPSTQEGVRQFHTFANDRELTVMGLFGSFIVEPRGSEYLEPLGNGDPTPATSGWQVIIKNGTGPDFREFVLMYHEVGDEAFRPVNKKGDFLPQRDPLTDAYRPGGRAINYRSEPFGINNMHVQHEYFGFEDESMGYSSYTFGDPSPTIPRSYMGDPAKFRLVHGGSEVFHSHHPHGGTIRWPRSPRAIDDMNLWSTAGNGPVKYPVIRAKTDRVDVEVIGPSEALDLETECGSGLCQQLAGDFLFHCHVAHHYVAGMWGYWRVYNTIQQGDMRNDVMPDLRELPDRKGRIRAPITSDKLVGQTVDWFGTSFKIVAKGKSEWKSNPATINIKDWVEMQLPTMGKPGHKNDEKGQIVSYDATVLDWAWEGTRALSEPESTIDNPKYKSTHPGKRHPITFEPLTGKVAWPHLTPHFGKRVMFSPNHSGAPWLEMIRRDDNGEESVDQAKPGEQGNWSLCPVNAGRKSFNVHFIKLPITIAKKTRQGAIGR